MCTMVRTQAGNILLAPESKKVTFCFVLCKLNSYCHSDKLTNTRRLVGETTTSLPDSHLFPLQDGEAVVEVPVPGSDQQEALVRKRTAGVLDMGGVSTQIAYEVPKTVSFASPQQVIIHNQFCFCAVSGFCHSPFVLLPPSYLCHSLVKPVCTIFVPWRRSALHSSLLKAYCKPAA